MVSPLKQWCRFHDIETRVSTTIMLMLISVNGSKVSFLWRTKRNRLVSGDPIWPPRTRVKFDKEKNCGAKWNVNCFCACWWSAQSQSQSQIRADQYFCCSKIEISSTWPSSIGHHHCDGKSIKLLFELDVFTRLISAKLCALCTRRIHVINSSKAQLYY